MGDDGHDWRDAEARRCPKREVEWGETVDAAKEREIVNGECPVLF